MLGCADHCGEYLIYHFKRDSLVEKIGHGVCENKSSAFPPFRLIQIHQPEFYLGQVANPVQVARAQTLVDRFRVAVRAARRHFCAEPAALPGF
jgi:hypothetical protein